MSELLHDILLFIYAVLTSLAGYLTGGLVIAAMFIYERIKNKPISMRTFWVGLVIFLFVSFFSAWRDEHTSVREATKTVTEMKTQINETKQNLTKEIESVKHDLTFEREHNIPKLSGNIDQVVIGDEPTLNQLQLLIQISVRNTGTPSIVDGWPVRIKSDSIDFTDKPTLVARDYYASTRNNDVRLKFQKGDFIYEKAVSPLANGARITGWLRYIIKGIPYSQINRTGTDITVSFYDITGQLYTTTYHLTDKQDTHPSYIPGGGQPFIRYNDKADDKTTKKP
ncbi:MAG: hypothetical protein U0Y68_11730 [Blastocatellia bacterium]